jgi:hypothetical protein
MKYSCNICNKEFTQKGHYLGHINKKNKCSIDDLYINGKKSYKCNFCEKIFDMKCNYILHNNKKNKCSNTLLNNNIDVIDTIIVINDINNDINESLTKNDTQITQELHQEKTVLPQKPHNFLDKKIDNNTCKNCDKIFSRLDSLKRHMKKCNNIIKDDNEQQKDIIIELKNKINEMDELKNKILEQEEKINELNNKLNNNTNNKTNINSNNINSNNTTNITNNTINYVNHGKEDLSKLIKDEIREILNSGYSCIYKSIMYTHYNDRLPEFKNIKYSDPKSSYCEVFIDGSWKLVKFENTIEELINKHFFEVSDLYNDNKDLIESKFKEGLIEDYIGDYYKFISYEEEDKYPDNWNKTMKREKQKKTRRRLNHNKDEIKTLIINKTISEKKILNDKKSSINSLK